MTPDDARRVGLRRTAIEVHKRGELKRPRDDWVVEEEPLEIRVDGAPLAVTLRTPGHDRELAIGFLVAEGVLGEPADLRSAEPTSDPFVYRPDHRFEIELAPTARARRARLEAARRETVASAACGMCGKRRLEDVVRRLESVAAPTRAVSSEVVRRLPAALREAQPLFDRTGGLHAAVLFDLDGRRLQGFEDVGRHNALDKLVGASFLAGALPWRDRLVAVSSRAGYELVVKAATAGAPALVAVGAASSLAVDIARRVGLELWSFAREDRVNRHV
ncbi:MAG: formate dehydrogenase accessory sulfurtransferase FdhD [Acidobacteriota bacterium]